MKNTDKTINALFYSAIFISGLFCFNACDCTTAVSNKKQTAPAVKKVEQKLGKKYSILVNAGSESQFFTELKSAYDSLLRLGFTPSNIYVLDDDIDKKNEGERSFVDKPATKKNLVDVLDELKQNMTDKDVFFFYVTNHGSKAYSPLPFGESCFKLSDGIVYENKLKEMFKDLNLNYGVCIFTTCYSGGLAESVGSGNFIGVSSSRADKVSFQCASKEIGSFFSSHFFAALTGVDKNNQQVSADNNCDGKISLEEAFDYAAKKDDENIETDCILPWANETPQLYWQNVDPSQVFLGE
ncbi:caspase family protein [Candidatus Woesearchaeota archaeon]|nr:caspase family protein [Candidatus Woesearchaeota archaeon]